MGVTFFRDVITSVTGPDAMRDVYMAIQIQALIQGYPELFPAGHAVSACLVMTVIFRKMQ
jgi:hypothetical protein